jgi:hypothetical protein
MVLLLLIVETLVFLGVLLDSFDQFCVMCNKVLGREASSDNCGLFDRLIGLRHGVVVLDGPVGSISAQALTDLYRMEAGEALA